jgi:hypothetical protein
MARKSKFKPGDLYQDMSLHPCLCIGASVDGRDVWGVSLVDGSYPRSCDPEFQSISKLSLEQAWVWRTKGPQGLAQDVRILPDEQWWWPKPQEGINPGHVAEHLFASSLLFLRNERSVCERFGGVPSGWWEGCSQMSDHGQSGEASASYVTRGPAASARVRVVAEKEGRLWPIQRITVEFPDGCGILEFAGEKVRGCGRAS